jgi:membrane fusion protein, multidrug efflux system
VAPVSAVRVDQARPYVLAVESGRVAQRTVELGLRGEAVIDGRIENSVELVSGIADGAKLLRASAGTVRDGAMVKLAVPATTVMNNGGATAAAKP